MIFVKLIEFLEIDIFVFVVELTFSRYLIINTSKMSEEHSKLPKFSGDALCNTSYSDWRFQVMLHAKGFGLSPYMTGTTNNLTDEDKPKYAKLAGDLGKSLKGEALGILKAIPDADLTARRAIRDLDTKYRSQNVSSRQLAIKDLSGTKKSDSQDIDAYVSEKARVLREDLGGQVTAEELLVGSICAGLGEEYDNVVNQVMATAPGAALPNTTDLTSQLREQERRNGARRIEVTVAQQSAAINAAKAAAPVPGFTEAVAALTDVANRMSRNYDGPYGGGKHGGRGKGKGKKGGVTCYNCGGQGHIAVNCWKPAAAPAPAPQPKAKGKGKGGKGGKAGVKR